MLSVGVVLSLVVLLLALTPRRHYDAVRVVDYQTQLEAARGEAPYHVFAPVGLSGRWRATSLRFDADYEGTTLWHLGFVTPEDRYAGIEQSNGPSGEFVSDLSSRGVQIGRMMINGMSWKKYVRTSRGVQTLARVRPDSTLVVTGTASFDELAELAGSLR